MANNISITSPSGKSATIRDLPDDSSIKKTKAAFTELWGEEVSVAHTCVEQLTCPACGAVTSYCSHDDSPGHCVSCKCKFISRDAVQPLLGHQKTKPTGTVVAVSPVGSGATAEDIDHG